MIAQPFQHGDESLTGESGQVEQGVRYRLRAQGREQNGAQGGQGQHDKFQQGQPEKIEGEERGEATEGMQGNRQGGELGRQRDDNQRQSSPCRASERRSRRDGRPQPGQGRHDARHGQHRKLHGKIEYGLGPGEQQTQHGEKKRIGRSACASTQTEQGSAEQHKGCAHQGRRRSAHPQVQSGRRRGRDQKQAAPRQAQQHGGSPAAQQPNQQGGGRGRQGEMLARQSQGVHQAGAGKHIQSGRVQAVAIPEQQGGQHGARLGGGIVRRRGRRFRSDLRYGRSVGREGRFQSRPPTFAQNGGRIARTGQCHLTPVAVSPGAESHVAGGPVGRGVADAFVGKAADGPKFGRQADGLSRQRAGTGGGFVSVPGPVDAAGQRRGGKVSLRPHVFEQHAQTSIRLARHFRHTALQTYGGTRLKPVRRRGRRFRSGRQTQPGPRRHAQQKNRQPGARQSSRGDPHQDGGRQPGDGSATGPYARDGRQDADLSEQQRGRGPGSKHDGLSPRPLRVEWRRPRHEA